MAEKIKTTVIVATYPTDDFKDKISNYLKSEPCKILIIGADKQRTFAENNNIGAKKADTPYILFLNSDTVPEPGFIKKMEKPLDSNKQFGLVGAKLYFLKDVDREVMFQNRIVKVKGRRGTVQHAGIVFNQRLLPMEFGRGMEINDPDVNNSRLVGGVTGACMMVRREEFLKMGGFDEKFKNGWEDSDLCLRYLEKGLMSYYKNDVQIGHYWAEGEKAGRFKHEDKNFEYWIKKWQGKDGRIYKLFSNHAKVSLDIGCGTNKKKGYLGIDKYAGEGVDIIFDLDFLDKRGVQMPWLDNSVDEVRMHHSLQRVENPINVLNELHRILKPWGMIEITVPHAFSWSAWANPFHKHHFIPETFTEYFASDKLVKRQEIDNQMRNIKPWHIDKISYTPVPVGVEPFSIEREIVVRMRPLK